VKPVRTPRSTNIYALPGGNEDSYLYVQETARGEIHSEWELTEAERGLLAGGGRVRLTIVGSLVPPVMLSVVRPHCRECRELKEWVEDEQAYVCTCAGEPLQ
jgi:hypothetical protein